MDTLCRDCTHWVQPNLDRCTNCAGQRLLAHSAMRDLNIAHIDCDAFFAAIEKRDNPALKHLPVIVGGGQRGVVSTCCYIARTYGVHSAMPMFKALKACPDAVVIRADFRKYSEAARAIRQKLARLTPLLEISSIDEAYLDLSGTTRINQGPPVEALVRLALEVERDVGITISIGLSANKFLAKTASEMDKPRGFGMITPEEAPDLLAPHPPGYLHGVGPRFAAQLHRDGFETIWHLQKGAPKDLILRYGERGLWVSKRAYGRDNRPVSPERVRKSVSSETTFAKDIAELERLEDHLWRLCVKVADQAKALDIEGYGVTLKLKTRGFKSLTRRTSLQSPTQLAQTLFRASKPLLAKEANGQRFRLIGIGLSNLQKAAQLDEVDLIDPSIEKRAQAERAADIARDKFGKESVVTGRAARMAKKTAR